MHTPRHSRTVTRLLILLMLVPLVTACGNPTETATAPRQLQPIADGDECHVCGMLIRNFPGPKAQAQIRNRSEALKFCSTVDLFSWLLQPETAGVLEAAYVHDMSEQDWQQPRDDRFIPADDAWYVAGHPLPGAMGPTLASFATRAAADGFAQRHGGRVVAFSAIDLALLAELGTLDGTGHSGHAHE